MSTQTATIGNGEKVSVGDTVYDAYTDKCPPRKVVDIRMMDGEMRPFTDAGSALPREMFKTRQEAIEYRIAGRRKAIEKAKKSIGKLRGEIAVLEQLAKEIAE